MTQLLQFRRCHGCGMPARDARALVALPADVYVCDDCLLDMAAIMANQSKEETRTRFVEAIVAILREPVEIVAKWKAIHTRATCSEATDQEEA